MPHTRSTFPEEAPKARTPSSRASSGGWLGKTIGSALGRLFGPRCQQPDTEVPQDAFSFDTQPASANSDRCDPSQSLVERMLAQHRYALLLRAQLIANLDNEQATQARNALAEGMCVVPGGEVVLRPAGEDSDHHDLAAAGQPALLRVEGYYLDRFPVTNAEFHAFVAGGGYEQMAIWDREIWPALLNFVDQTAKAGPRFWRDGHYAQGEDRHPVVGVSWYEAAAYARWVGKRLPTDAEWVKAAGWPVAIAGGPLVQRRYPWGDAMDRSRANLWGGPGQTVPVDAYPAGVSVAGVQQLIGNVWEWTTDSLTLDGPDDLPEDGPRPMIKSIRGGAFDTYLDCQATCYFQSGDRALSRKHNVGFRCAISWADVSTHEEEAPQADNADEIDSSLVEMNS
jgi:gamma-glutamyl hercynylcysteine S-oxide synthase